MLELFETVPCGTLATIASVVLDREVSLAMAREAHRRAVERAAKKFTACVVEEAQRELLTMDC
jgi:hypothetical protein